MKRHATGLALIALLLAACGTTGGAATTVAATTDTSPAQTTLPAAEDVVLVVEDVGGFVPIEFALGRGPRYVLTGDGRLIFQGPMIEIFPQPLWPNYQVRQLTEDELDLVMDAITRHRDRPDHRRGGRQLGQHHRRRVDHGDHLLRRPGSSTASRSTPSTSGKGKANRCSGLPGWCGFSTEWPPPRAMSPSSSPRAVQVIAQEAEPTGDEFEQVVDFPIDEDPATWDDLAGQQGIKCASFEGEDAQALVERFREANQATLFEAGDTTWRCLPSPLLPGEEPCEVPAFAG